MKHLFTTLICIFFLVMTSYGQKIIRIDGQSDGRTFEGIGALSAGASSRLLIDYPEPYRTQVLDYLFKPGFGASLHHLKVEIGGDVNSTDGTESSHMHTREDENYQRGYEWWLMKEAKKRNPDIYLDALEWGAPFWIGDGKFYSQDNADYIVKFLNGAKYEHQLDIDFVGIWNETPYNIEWIKLLRKTLDKHGFNKTGIIAGDQPYPSWQIAEDIMNDQDLYESVYAIGDHYLGYSSTETAKNSQKPLWASEDGPWRGDWIGARLLAKMYNRNYIDGRLTKTITWSLVSSYYDNLSLPSSGLMRANTPWSGYYEVQPALWAVAHTTQFTQPGWKYLDDACGYLDNGSYVTLKSPDLPGDFTMIIETMDAPYSPFSQVWMNTQNLNIEVSDDLSKGPVYVWRTNEREYFELVDTIEIINKTFTVELTGESLYTLTTTNGQQKGQYVPPNQESFPLPYEDDFELYENNKSPKYFSDQAGVFEVAACKERRGKCLRQVVPEKGIEWIFSRNHHPETVLGSLEWDDIEVSVDVFIENTGFAAIYGRVGKVNVREALPPDAYWFKVDHQGKWVLYASNLVIAEGSTEFSPGKWHRLRLTMVGDNISVHIDNRQVVAIDDSTYQSGMVAIGSSWDYVSFDDFRVNQSGQNHK